ncbi:MAG: TVP38/TMEM64 family protein [Scytolyngbya sp. HA4215-MV1]|jgi:uncharacterized membrane protein YdjX (TVP38/TMEM64 family)|nr:TVP38/TMEM64 family protein [Scytolyngbya sp. HA4215-MV1]
MLSFKKGLVLLILICILATAIGMYLIGGVSPVQIQAWLKHAGVWAPIIYIVFYILATVLVLPSTPLNLTGGAIFGPWMGTVWTSIAAVLAAIVTFTFTRTVGRDWVMQKLAGRWQAIDAELRQGGLFYMFAIRLQPVIPYGIVNLAAGLTSVSFKDYVLGTALGTIPGVLPFVMLGDSGLKAIRTGDVLPLLGALGLVGILIGGGTWYYRRRQDPRKDLQKAEQQDLDRES